MPVFRARSHKMRHAAARPARPAGEEPAPRLDFSRAGPWNAPCPVPGATDVDEPLRGDAVDPRRTHA